MAISLATSVDIPLAEILAAATQRPAAEAFQHRRRSAWVTWTLGEVRTRAEALAAALERSQPAPRLVAISGDYTPNLVLIALAAAQAGARVVVLPPTVSRAALMEWLGAEQPELAFVGLREQIGIWRAALRQTGLTTAILADIRLPWGQPRHGGVLSTTELLGPPPPGGANAPRGALVWIEEGTEWAEGLSYILHTAAHTERVLAFPESRAAAARDRRAAQPVDFALSAAHHRQVQEDLAARLPAGRGATARAISAALSAAAGGRPGLFDRWLLHRLRRPLGLARLRKVTVVAANMPLRSGGGDLFSALGIVSGHVVPPEPAPAAATAGLASA